MATAVFGLSALLGSIAINHHAQVDFDCALVKGSSVGASLQPLLGLLALRLNDMGLVDNLSPMGKALYALVRDSVSSRMILMLQEAPCQHSRAKAQPPRAPHASTATHC